MKGVTLAVPVVTGTIAFWLGKKASTFRGSPLLSGTAVQAEHRLTAGPAS